MALKQTKTAAGIEIYFYEPLSESKMGPVIVLPGGPGLSSQLYQRYLKDLCPRQGIIFWDYANTGRSVIRSMNSFENDFNDLNQITEKLNLKTFSLMGHSYGGLIALKAAIEGPERVQNLCLISTSDYFLPVITEMPVRKAERLSAKNQEELNQIYGRLLKNSLNLSDLSNFCELEAQSHFLNVTPELKKLFAKDSGLNLNVLATNSDWVSLNFKPLLNKITAKTMVVLSKKDIIVPALFSQDLVAKIPKAQAKEFNSSGHWPFIEEPKRFSDIIEDFFT